MAGTQQHRFPGAAVEGSDGKTRAPWKPSVPAPYLLKGWPSSDERHPQGDRLARAGSPRYEGISGAEVNEDAVPTTERLRHSADVGLVLLQALCLLFLLVSRVSLTSLGTGASSSYFRKGGTTLRVSLTPDGTQLTVCGLCFLRL